MKDFRAILHGKDLEDALVKMGMDPEEAYEYSYDPNSLPKPWKKRLNEYILQKQDKGKKI